MSSESDSQNISEEVPAQSEGYSTAESSSEQPSAGNDSAIAEEVQGQLRTEMEAEEFEQVVVDEEMALALQVAEEEEEKERQQVTVAVLPSRGAGEASSSRPIDAVPLRVASGKKRKKQKAAPKKKQAAVDAGQPVGIPEGHSYLNTAALDLKTKAVEAEYLKTQLLVGPSAQVVVPGPDDVLLHPPEGCCAVHILSVELGLRFPLHPFLVEYLRFVGLAPCQLTPNSHSYIAGFLSLCRSRGVEPTLDQFFLSFNLCRGGAANSEGFANLQQLPAWRLFSEVPSSHKGWKDRFCYLRMPGVTFPRPLRNHFRRHLKVGNASLESNGRKLTKKSPGSEKLTTIKAATLPEELLQLEFQRYRLPGEKDERYPLFDRGSQTARGGIMDPKAFAKLSKQMAKEERRRKEGSSTKKPVDSFPKKDGAAKTPEGEGPSKKSAPGGDAGSGAGSSQLGELKRKNAGKGVKLPEKKKARGDAGQEDTPVVVIDDPPTIQPSASAPLEDLVEGAWTLETVHFPIKKGTAIMHGTLDPREFLRGATPSVDRSTLSRFGDEALELKALQASATVEARAYFLHPLLGRSMERRRGSCFLRFYF
ncbi:unnamed protein product [Cuscuta epithymum]|uniref:Transposase (putative) gypsy type domain-containing protein n=1 Tax=Cuscuta epithymum TaxID=186058 RepID=A0AAV0DGW2_9ASTE|nr:unnamed protein product [Cuscuta epithymum]